jgi:hypothetical protein
MSVVDIPGIERLKADVDVEAGISTRKLGKVMDARWHVMNVSKPRNVERSFHRH